MELLREVRAPGILVLTLNQAKQRNAINAALLIALVNAFTEARRDPAIRVVVLTGAGSVFCAGGDLSQLDEPANDKASEASLTTLLNLMHDMGKPIVAMVNGHAFAGGLGLMVACDLVVASEDACFGMSEIRVGLWPMMITAELTRNIGRKRCLELMLTGRRVDSAEAIELGLINRAVPLSDLESETMALAESLAAQSQEAMARGLRAFYQTQDLPFAEALNHLGAEFAALLQTDDAKEGLQAFVARRKPTWK